MIDTYKHKGQRLKLVSELRQKGIADETVLTAIEKIPRHLFMDSSLEIHAYKDQAMPISSGQTISQPYTVAFQTQLLNVQKNDKILEVGTGSGYQTAILCELGAKVYTIERQKELFDKTQILLKKMGYIINGFYGDGYLGLPTYGPFDKILITAGAPYIPEQLILQLKVNGLLVAPIGNTNVQIMTVLKKITESNTEIKEHGSFIFVPMLKGKA
ncbi:MAG: protein-L-isoaspartate O-methyltransferase [Bacteroidetes bacterium GWA2_30_7]|nr:MAG: protein-L-isoaspartate O-methyltransferase [Bacteroidetes bacterium GWA2_30_7]